MRSFRRQLPLYAMIIPGIAIVFAYQYVPMFGVMIAFQKFSPAKGFLDSPWVGWGNFEYIFNLPDFSNVLYNTISIAVMKIIAGLVVPITFALMLNEILHSKFKRIVQTVVYLPHFLSWVLLSGILIDILSPSSGIVNQILKSLGFDPIFFLGDNRWFPYTMVVSDVWKEFGFATIVYLAAITSVDPSLYEAAVIDGASRWRQTWHITLPGMAAVIILLATLSLGNVLNAGFDQIFNLYNASVFESGDIIDTQVYRLAFQNQQYSLSTAVGLFKSVISFVLISVSYFLAYRLANYRIF